ncbi:MAG: Acetyltransferase domain [Actinomycetia bacterium]|nr:Acetyltransferase domain [Actinomycetes bacterium]
MTAETSIVSRPAADDERPEVMRLLEASLGWDLAAGLAEYFDWKHLDNPFGRSPAWVALDGERIVGFRTFLRWEFEDRDRTVRRAVRAVDTATHPEYQGRGIFRLLTLAAVRQMTDEGVNFVFNTPNDKSRPGYLKMGWHQVGRPATSVRVRSPLGLARMLASRVPADRWPLPGAAGAPAIEILGDGRIDALLAALAPPQGLRTRRTREYLRWRYGFAPLGYRALTAGRDPAEGVAVFRVRRRGKAAEAALCEMLVPDGATGAARHLARAVARTTGADYVVRLGRATPVGGFLPLPRQGPILTWRALDTTADAPPALDEWQLSLGDVELL